MPTGWRASRVRRFIALYLLGLLLASSAAGAAESDLVGVLDTAIGNAERSLQQGDHQAAEKHYREALFEGWLLMAAIERFERRFPQARTALGKAGAFVLETPTARRSLAAAELQMGETSQALEILTGLARTEPQDSETRRLLARALVADGQVERAIEQLDEASASAPDDPESSFLLATEYLWLKKVDKAERLFARLAEARPMPQTRVLIGRAYRDAGDYDRARDELRAALSQDPNVRRAHYYLGMVALADARTGPERLERAIAEFQQELKLASDDPLANDQLGIALLEAERPADALPAFETAVARDERFLYVYHLGRCQLTLGRNSEAALSSRRALELAGQQGAHQAELEKIHYQLGLALRRVGAIQEAATHLAEAKRMAVSGTDSSREETATDRYDTAEASPLSELGSARRLELRQRVSSGLARSYFNLGVLEVQGRSPAPAAERFARAAAFFEAAADMDPDFPQVQSSLGVAYFNARQFDKATAPLIRALAANPADAGLRRMLAMACLNTQTYAKAAELLRDDAERETNPSLQFAFGLALVKSDRAAEAEKILTALLAQQGDSAELSVLLGQAYAQQGKNESAIELLTRVLQLETDVAEADATLGIIYLQQGRFAEAVERLEVAARLTPDDATVRERLGLAYQKLGRTELAQQQFEASRRLKAKH